MTEELGIPVGNYNDDGELIVTIGSHTDELQRPMVRAESRDDHDTTYFVLAGDKWTQVTDHELTASSDGVQSVWNLPHMEVKNVVARLVYPTSSSSEDSSMHDEIPYSVDYSEYDSLCNKAEHFSRGVLTFDESPPAGCQVLVSYEYATIGDGTEIVYDQAVDGDSKTIDIRFCDPAHIKDGLVAFEGGKLDSKINVYAYCPQIGTYSDDRLANYEVAPGVFYRKYHFYKDDNEDVQLNTGAHKLIAHYVVNQRLMGEAYVGMYFHVEARSSAFPPGYFLRVVFDAGSATNLKAYARLEINRQRTAIK